MEPAERRSPAAATVAVVAICGPEYLERCLAALDRQRGAPPFEVVVVYDPALGGIEPVAERHGARAVANAEEGSPPALAARAIRESRGEWVLLTEDHTIPGSDWVATMCAAGRPGRAVVGGRVEIRDEAAVVDWACYFVDFFRYASPVEEGPFPSLTHCNAAYRRSDLEQIRHLWQRHFHETEVNEALRRRFGVLWLTPESVVTMRRHVRFGDALRERYAYGRLFGCTRLAFCGPGRRLYYTLLAPSLPLLLMARLARKGLGAARLRRPFLRALPVLVALVVAWSWGEWLGYLTRRHPRSLAPAPER